MSKLLCLLASTLALTGMVVGEEKKDALTELYGKLSAVSPKVVKAGYTILHIEFDRLGSGPSVTFKRQLQKGFKYKIVGVGAQGIADIEVKLLDSKNKVVAKDEGQDGVGIINLAPAASGTYTVRVAAAKMDGEEGARPYFFCLVASKPQKSEQTPP